jgi:hypothetical protein
MNVLLLRWDTKPDKRIRGTLLTSCIDTQNVFLCRPPRDTSPVSDGQDAPKAEWVSELPSGPPERESLARIVDADGGQDDAENAYYESAADPDAVRLETARRRFRGQYLRRLRRLGQR